MNGIDRAELDETIAKAFKEVRTAIDTHSEKSLQMYSNALSALVELRQQVVSGERAAG
ncbi:hypothetical protein IQ279_04185 [Streptomyces verrucosisporus]|uniref:hypothetical protein n=1 Tax=Streptomyces verrucosisporus TaxID=1695161 RepID=UPI0019D0B1F4|nr:hypothetical protein [Streptomyces verrucosisporus]MBN3928847.1 hypothetical protein [Streptomyces verrucosisporus]